MNKKLLNELHKIRNKLIISGEKPNNAINLAQKEMNKKYGIGWRNEVDLSKKDCGKI